QITNDSSNAAWTTGQVARAPSQSRAWPITTGPATQPAHSTARYQALARSRAESGRRSPSSASPSGQNAPEPAPISNSHKANHGEGPHTGSAPQPSRTSA